MNRIIDVILQFCKFSHLSQNYVNHLDLFKQMSTEKYLEQLKNLSTKIQEVSSMLYMITEKNEKQYVRQHS